MKYCYKCGKELNDIDSFCSFCGTKQNIVADVNKVSKDKLKRNIYDNLGLIGMIGGIFSLSFGQFFTLIPIFGVIFDVVLSSTFLILSILGIIYAASKKKCIVGTVLNSIALLVYLLNLTGLASIGVIIR